VGDWGGGKSGCGALGVHLGSWRIGRWWCSGEVDEVESTVVRGVGILGES